MSTADNKQVVRRLFLDYFNTGRLDVDDLVSPDFEGVGPERGPAAFATVITNLRGAFPDLVYTIDDMVAEGDRVTVRWTWRGTHRNSFRTFEATNSRVENHGIGIFQITNTKLVRAWLETDRLGFLQVIGAIPFDPRFAPAPPSR
jgi:predicted ester cyclase